MIGVTPLDEQRVAEWIGDAFAILCVRTGGLSASERDLRLGVETILRLLHIPPLRVLARSAPVPYRRVVASRADFRHILKALESCLTIFARYEHVLTPGQREVQSLLQRTRHCAQQELEQRLPRTPERVSISI